MSRDLPLLLIFVLFTAGATAGTVEFELPAEWGEHTYALALKDVVVDAAILSIDSEEMDALFWCARGVGQGTEYFFTTTDWSLRLDVVFAGEDITVVWRPATGPDTASIVLIAPGGGGIALGEGQITIGLTALPSGIVTLPGVRCSLTNPGALNLTGPLRLAVDYQGTAPADRQPWGTIKAAYR